MFSSANECSCVPWDILRPDNYTYNLCDATGNDCFYQKMLNHSHVEDNCSCLPDCNSVKFSFTEKQVPLKTEKYCSRMSQGWLDTLQNYDFMFQK